MRAWLFTRLPADAAARSTRICSRGRPASPVWGQGGAYRWRRNGPRPGPSPGSTLPQR